MTAPQPQGLVWPRPDHPELARLYDQALIDGKQIRFASNEKLVTWQEQHMGCAGFLFMLFLAVITLGLALLFGLAALGSKDGILTTYEVKPNGRIKTKTKVSR